MDFITYNLGIDNFSDCKHSFERFLPFIKRGGILLDLYLNIRQFFEYSALFGIH